MAILSSFTSVVLYGNTPRYRKPSGRDWSSMIFDRTFIYSAFTLIAVGLVGCNRNSTPLHTNKASDQLVIKQLKRRIGELEPRVQEARHDIMTDNNLVVRTMSTYPKTVGRISNMGVRPLWISDTPLYSRYDLGIEFPIVKSHKSGLWTQSNKAYIVINEVKRVQGRTTSFGKQWTLSSDEFKKVLDKGGDFSVVGIHLLKNAHVPNFDEYWKSNYYRGS